MGAKSSRKRRKPSRAVRARASVRPSSVAARSTRAQRKPRAVVLVAACLASVTGFVLLPSLGNIPSAVATILVFRGLVAGCIAGLILARPAPAWVSVLVALGSSIAGTSAVSGLAAGSVTPGGAVLGLLAAVVSAGCFAYLGASGGGWVARVATLSLLLVVMLWYAGIVPSVALRQAYLTYHAELAVPPQPEQYAFDGASFLHTYDLMKQGRGYYDAFRQGIVDDSRHDAAFITSRFNYREPFVFYLWKVLPGSDGSALWGWFVVYAALALVASYTLASGLVSPGVAVLAPAALLSFFTYFFWADTWFTITEIWAAGFGVAAVMCLVRKWHIPGVVLLTAAVAAREFMVLLIPAWIVVWWFSEGRRSNWWLPVAAMAGPGAALVAHLMAVPATAGGAGALGGWLHGGLDRLVAALRFGFDLMPGGTYLSLVFAVLAIWSAALARPRSRAAGLLAVTALPTLFLFTFSAGIWHDYWGAFYMPLAVSIAPGVLGRVLPPQQAAE